VRLVVDDVFQSRARSTEDFVELNIDFGLLLGVRFTELPIITTQSDYDDDGVQSSSSFRGCLRGVLFNEVEVLMTVAGPTDPASRSSAVIWNRSDDNLWRHAKEK